MAKKLAVFDFDHTIVDDNTDIVARKLLKNEYIPESVKKLYRTNGWTVYMQEIFKLLKKHKISPDTVKKAIINIPEVPQTKKFITLLATALKYHVIIISDSNSLFIDYWLDAHKMKNYIHTVFTNPAAYNKESLLEIKGYHEQHECKLSTVNLCKGQILEEFLKSQKEKNITYDQIIYAGDGKNDLCPILRLGEKDVACVRAGYALEEIIKKNEIEHINKKILAKVCIWNNADDILNFIS